MGDTRGSSLYQALGYTFSDEIFTTWLMEAPIEHVQRLSDWNALDLVRDHPDWPSGRTPLTLMAGLHDLNGFDDDVRIEAIERLLIVGANPNVADHLGRTPLHLASAIGHAVVVQRLLVHGADPHATDHHGNTALHTLHLMGSDEMEQTWEVCAQHLLNAGSDVNARNALGFTPLQTLLTNATGITDTAHVLIMNGADIHVRRANGATLLHLAHLAEPAFTSLLLEHGADVNARTKQDETVLWAHINLPRGMQPISVFAPSERFWIDQAERVRVLMDAGADPNISVPVSTAFGGRETPWSRLVNDVVAFDPSLQRAREIDAMLQGGANLHHQRSALGLGRTTYDELSDMRLGLPGSLLNPSTELTSAHRQRMETWALQHVARTIETLTSPIRPRL